MSEKTFNFACYARYWFAKGDKEAKRQILSGIGSNIVLKDKKLCIDVTKPLQFIETAKQAVVEISSKFEPKKESVTALQLEKIWSQNTTLLEFTEKSELISCVRLARV